MAATIPTAELAKLNRQAIRANYRYTPELHRPTDQAMCAIADAITEQGDYFHDINSADFRYLLEKYR